MNTIETFFLDLGLSWMASKALPYLLFILFGLLLFLITRKLIKFNKWVNRLATIIIIAIPFSIYFALYPIYEGDFSNQGNKPKSSVKFSSTKALTVIALPDCPYCYQSISLMKKIKKRNPTIEISYWVVSSDTIPERTAILSVIPNDFNVIQRHDVVEISNLALGTFPCYVLSEKNKALRVWNNNQFGVCALDEIEDFFR
jgi:hypothetical protein